VDLLFDLEISEFKSTFDDYLKLEWNIIRKKAKYLKKYYDDREKARKKEAQMRKKK